MNALGETLSESVRCNAHLFDLSHLRVQRREDLEERLGKQGYSALECETAYKQLYL